MSLPANVHLLPLYVNWGFEIFGCIGRWTFLLCWGKLSDENDLGGIL